MQPVRAIEPNQLIEIEVGGKWQRVATGSPAAQLHQMRQSSAANARRLDRMNDQLATLEANMRQITPPKPEIHSLAALETASLSKTLRRSEAWAFIEREAAQISTREGLSKATAVLRYCERRGDVYRMYRDARDDAPPSKPLAAPAPRTVGAAEAALDAKARAYAEAHNVTFASAMVSVAEQNPALYRQHMAEQRTAVK